MKRSELKRRTPLKASDQVRATVRLRKCPVKKGGCGASFQPLRQKQIACLDCAVPVGRWLKDKEDKRVHKEKQTEAKPLSHWLELTERVVNAFVLQRDRERPCISCGTFKTVQWEAGHYRNVGSYPEIRFDLRNITKQCHRCNCDLHGNKDNYRIGYVERNGQEPMDWLEGPHPTAKYTREGLATLRAEIRARANALEREIKNV